VSGTHCCDICGGIENEGLERDEDGLWICSACGVGLVTAPVGETEVADLSDEVRALVGKSVGAICITLNLPHEPPYHRIINHTVEMHNNLMSVWAFVTQWADGTTVWRDEEGSAIAFVSGDEVVHIRLD